MRAALTTEYRKLVTTRLWWVLLVTMGAYMAFLGAALAFPLTIDGGGAMTGAPGDDPGAPGLEFSALDVATAVYAVAPAFGYVFPVIVGALSVTGEFRHMTITPSLLAEPRRTVVLAAKMVAALPVGLVFGLVGTAGGVAGGAVVLALTGNDPLLTDPEVLLVLGRSVGALAVWAVVGVGFGAALPNQVAAIVTLLAFTQFVEPILRFLLGAVDGLGGVAPYLPGAAGEALAGSSFFAATGLTDLLTWWQGLLVLIGYAVLLAALGRLTTLRRDVT